MSVPVAEKSEVTPAVPGDAFPGLPATHSWTLDDLARLPDDGRRYEIIDGSLHVTPAPALLHQRYCTWLMRALLAELPDEYDVVAGANVLLPAEPTRLLVPDVLAVRLTDIGTNSDPLAVPATAVPIAVEVVSPSSTAHDRFTKPALYAEAGIPHYWRVETGHNGPTVHLYALATEATEATEATDLAADADSAVYTRTHVVRPGQTTTVEVPWKITLTPPQRPGH